MTDETMQVLDSTTKGVGNRPLEDLTYINTRIKQHLQVSPFAHARKRKRTTIASTEIVTATVDITSKVSRALTQTLIERSKYGATNQDISFLVGNDNHLLGHSLNETSIEWQLRYEREMNERLVNRTHSTTDLATNISTSNSSIINSSTTNSSITNSSTTNSSITNSSTTNSSTTNSSTTNISTTNSSTTNSSTTNSSTTNSSTTNSSTTNSSIYSITNSTNDDILLELETVFDSDNGNNGVMFDLTSPNGTHTVTIVEINLHVNLVNPACPILVYGQMGTHVGIETSSQNWSLLVNTTVLCAGFGKKSRVPLGSSRIVVQGGETFAIYTSLQTPNL